jgi:uncharacterized membrane protein (DUF4010 family)
VLVCRELYWLAATLTVASLLLLEFKTRLETLAQRIDPTDILIFTQFLLLAAVILPLLPNQAMSRFQINPFNTWLVVVAVSAISYGSYLLQRLRQGRGGLLLAALAGGAYSSTVTTVVLARRSAGAAAPREYAGAIVMASGMMYLRLMAFLALFNFALLLRLWPLFSLLAALALLGGWLWSKSGSDAAVANEAYQPKNPLEISTALLFAVLFIAHAGSHPAGGAIPGRGRRLHAGGGDGRQRRGPVHHGHHRVHAAADAAAGGGRGHFDRRLGQ